MRSLQRNCRHRGHPSHRGLAALLIGAVALPTALATMASAQGSEPSCFDPWPLRRAVTMYTGSALPKPLLDQIADRFEFVLEGYRPDLTYMFNKNSKMKYMLSYTSVTDNYVTPGSGKHEWLVQHAPQYGITGEDAYLHFWEDTTVELQGQRQVIPGWNPSRQGSDPPATASSRDQARVPVYYPNLSRRCTNYTTQALRDLNRDYVVNMLNQQQDGGWYPGGVMLDNAAHITLNVSIINGGRVAEHPTHEKFNSDAFVEWYWMGGVRLFMEELTNYIDDNPSVFGGRQVYVVPNVANAPYIGSSNWERSYVNPPAAHTLLMEFEYNPTRDFGMDLPLTIYNKHTAALNAGISIYETGYLFQGAGGINGSFTQEQAVMNNIASHWVHRADDAGTGASTFILGVNVWDIYAEQTKWELNLSPAFDVDLGRPLGPPFVLQQGTDGKGYPYKVFARSLQCGLAVVRHRDPYNGDFDEATAVAVDLNDLYAPVDIHGAILSMVDTWSLRNGQGQIFLADGSAGTPDSVAPENPTNLRQKPSKK